MYLLLPKIYMHFESIMSKDLEGRLGAKRHSGANHRKGANENVPRDKNDDLPSTSHDSAKLLSYRAGECEPMYKNERVFINFCCAGRVNKTETLTNLEVTMTIIPEIKFPISLTIGEFTQNNILAG